MSTTITLQVAPRQINPRGAEALADVAVYLYRAAERALVKLAALSSAVRSASQLRQLGASFETKQA